MATNQESNNGQSQVNSVRNSFNSNVSRLSILGKTKKVKWDGKRRNRSI